MADISLLFAYHAADPYWSKPHKQKHNMAMWNEELSAHHIIESHGQLCQKCSHESEKEKTSEWDNRPCGKTGAKMAAAQTNANLNPEPFWFMMMMMMMT